MTYDNGGQRRVEIRREPTALVEPPGPALLSPTILQLEGTIAVMTNVNHTAGVFRMHGLARMLLAGCRHFCAEEHDFARGRRPPRQVYAELLDEGKYMASPSTMYRIPRARAESGERRDQRAPKSHAVTSWPPRRTRSGRDISKFATYVQGIFLNLYLVLDMFSRFPVAWMIAQHENSALAKQLFAEAITRYKLEPGSITVHNYRGAPMTAVDFIDLLATLGVQRSLSRPRVSNDNPFSEACFKTIKYQPDYPGRFGGAGHARHWFAEFFDWYAYRYRHSGLALFTPAESSWVACLCAYACYAAPARARHCVRRSS